MPTRPLKLAAEIVDPVAKEGRRLLAVGRPRLRGAAGGAGAWWIGRGALKPAASRPSTSAQSQTLLQ